MIRIAALNDDRCSDNTLKESPSVATTKEAQESAAFALYNRALQLENDGNLSEAESVYKELLQASFLREVRQQEEIDEADKTTKKRGSNLSLQLKYSTYKNLANIANKKGDYESAMESYLEAVSLDSTDVTLWYRIGNTALKIENYPLGSLAFQEALRCNPNHWASLDNLVTLMYTLNDYYTCLYYISRALMRDSGYVKGLSLRDKIFLEHPALRKDTEEFFAECDDEIFRAYYDEEDGKRVCKTDQKSRLCRVIFRSLQYIIQHVDEALEMRRIKREKSRPGVPPVLNFIKPFTNKTWKNLGECIIDLYDIVSKAERPISFSCLVNVAKYVTKKSSSESQAEVNSSTCARETSSLVNVPSVISGSQNSEVPEVVSESSEVVATEMEVIEDGHSLSQGETINTFSAESAVSRNKGRKRKSFPFEYMDSASKRRSARVRNTATKKQQEYVNFTELLQKFLPSSLLSNSNDEGADSSTNGKSVDNSSEQSASDDGQGTGTAAALANDQDSRSSISRLEDSEEADVENFLENCRKNTGVLDVMYRYVMAVAEKHSSIWPVGLTDVYVQLYSRLRDHIMHPSLFCQDRDDEEIGNEGIATLIYCEFKVEIWMRSKAHVPSSVSSVSPENFRVPSPIQLGPDFPGRHFAVDVEFLTDLTIRSDIFKEMFVEFQVRVLWLKARFLMLQGQMDFSVDCFDRVSMILKSETRNTNCNVKIVLQNCPQNDAITLEEVQKQLESLQQCQSLEELHRLHLAGEYQQVVDLLLPTFGQRRPQNKVASNSSIPERHSQLLLLQDALWNLGDQQQCLYWGELSFHEALHQYEMASSSCSSAANKQDWASTLSQLLSKIERFIHNDPTIIRTLAAAKLKRFIQNLIRVIVIQMESPESVSDLPIKSLIPWILLYYTIQQEEEKIRSLMVKSTPGAPHLELQESDSFGDGEFGPGMPSSLMALHFAHEYLGRRGWCTHSTGALLLLYLDVLMQELKKSTTNNPHPYKEDLENSLEQCFFCLYGHPNKKTKAKRLQDHGSPQISLTWERAIPLFEYFKPKQFPEFDSLKAITISADLEYLLRRIYALVPTEEDPGNRIDFICAYIEGSTDKLPNFDKDLSKRPTVQELYYLLADYYFKNNEQGKAIKFYLLDVAVNPKRLDSWAGMALARSSQLEQKLNSCELRNEGPIYKKATAALRCFDQALKLESTTISLWIEYGTLAYILHSYSCRQLKQKAQLELGAEVIQMLTAKRTEMLKLAFDCFTSANQCSEESAEEEWLHHYMLGKLAEKQRKSPKEYLHHYKLAAMHLHIEGACYPRKIQYHNPPHLSIEALEVYFRTHASVLKFLQMNEGKILDNETKELLEAYIKDAADGAFANFQEKRLSSQNASDAEDDAVLLQECRKLRKVVNPLVNDHDYFKRKRKNSMSEESGVQPPRHRPSVDSSSESQDSAAVKDILNSIVSEISERIEESSDKIKDVGTIVVGDTKIIRPTALASKNPPTGEEKIEKIHCKESTSADQNQSKSAMAENLSSKKDEKDDDSKHSLLVQHCVDALRQCLHRFPQHYKSLYRLANFYFRSKNHRNIQWSLDYLIGPQVPWQQTCYMTSQALFAERKNTNFFNGIWRIPSNEIDRPGSFASHMFRSILLLIDILEEKHDHNLMVHVAILLHRNPDAGKKYLRDVDRLYLARACYDRCIALLLQKMNELCAAEATSINRNAAVRHLMDIFRSWQGLQKVVSDQEVVNKLLEKAFIVFRRGKVDTIGPVLDQAIRFCQQQQLLTKTPQTPTYSHGDAPSFPEPRTLIRSQSYEPKVDVISESHHSTNSTKPQISLHGNKSDANARSEMSEVTPKACPLPSTSTQFHHITGTTNASNFTNSRSILLSSFHALSSPNLLTADVQSKIKSLDPIEQQQQKPCVMIQRPVPAKTAAVSGFQLEFLRQIGASPSMSGSKSEIGKFN